MKRIAPPLPVLRPEDLLPIRSFYGVSGVSRTRCHEAKRLLGLELPTIAVGRRKFVEGAAAIGFIKQLAELEKSTT